MGEIVFVGLGLHDEKGISLQGLEEVRTADNVFIELYTNLLSGFSEKNFRKIAGREFRVVSREELEDKSGEIVLEAAKAGKAVLLVPGDPLIATTHIALRIDAERLGIETRVIHGSSILSAVIGLSGLHSYKFGKSVTLPLPSSIIYETPYDVVALNQKLGLHTLCLLDIDMKESRYLEIREGLNLFLRIERMRGENVITGDTLVVGVARAGSRNMTVKAGFLKDLIDYHFGDPPHTIVFPGKLHFMESEALVALAGAPQKIRTETT